MNWWKECAAVVPCFNEQAAIGAVVAGLRLQVNTVFVVDDGSSDNTAAEARLAGATVLQHPRNQGKGAALNTGWSHAHREGFSWALTLDGDGQHAVGDVPHFFRAADQSKASLIIGNRMPGASRMPWVRRLVNRAMSLKISRLAGQPLPDTQCGFRLMDLKTWACLSLCANHFEIESEVLLAFIRANKRVEFVRIEVIYKDELSKIHPVRDTIRWLRWLGRIPETKSPVIRTVSETSGA